MLLLAIALAAASPAADKQETKVELNGATYRVLVRGNEVLVAKKSLMVRRSPDERDAMRDAAKKAIGCDMGEPYWEGAKLVGKKRCGE